MAYHTTGTKYEASKGMDVAAIAKLIRSDIKAAVKAGELPADFKASVTISRYSGGQSLRVSFAAPSVNPITREWATADSEERWGYHGQAMKFTEEGKRIAGVISAIHSSYNFNNSDSMTDYFHVRYYGDAGWDSSFLRDCEAAAAIAPAVAVAEPVADVPAPIVETAPALAPTLGQLIMFPARQAADLAPCIAGPARVVVNEDRARFAFFLGLEEG